MSLNLEQTMKDEESLIGGILCNPESIYQASELIDSKSFVSDGFGLVFQAIQTMLQIGTPITRSNVSTELVRIKAVDAIGGIKRIVELLHDGQPQHVTYYAELVGKHAKRRNLLAFIDQIKARSLDPSMDPMELAGEMSKAIGIMGGETDQQKQIGRLVIEFLEDCERIKAEGKELVFATGIDPLDQTLDGGFLAGTITIGARPVDWKVGFRIRDLLQGGQVAFDSDAICESRNELSPNGIQVCPQGVQYASFRLEPIDLYARANRRGILKSTERLECTDGVLA